MANYLFVFTIVIVTASVSQSAQILKLLTNSKAFQPGVENDAKNDWGVDQDARGNQRQWIINKERTSQDVYRQKGKEGLQAVANVQEKLNTIKDLMQHGLPNKNKIKQESISVSLLQSQYYDTPKRKQQKSTDKSLQGNSLSNLLLYFYPTESVAKVFDTKRSSNTVRTSRKPSYYDDVDPGDGEGWFNYPITRPSVPNPAWHLSTLRRIYQQPRRIFKRSPKRRSKKRKRNKDERKKYNKKKRSRRKRRLMKGEKKKPKKKKGDGSYRGGRGRKPRMHKKRTNATLEHTKGGNDTEYYTEEESEGPVAGAYIDYDSSYEPPPKEEGEITDGEHKNNTNNAADGKDKTEKNAGSGDSKYETEEEGSGDSEYETDEEGSGDSEYETDEEGSGDSEYETDEEGSGDDETEEEEDGSGDEEYETEEESEENRSDEESTDDKSGDKKLKSEEDKNGNIEHKNGTKKACKNGICKEIKLDSKNVLESKIKITKVKEINSDVMKLQENQNNRKKLDIKDNLQHTIKNNEEDKKLRINNREDILFKHELKPNTNEIINQLKLQQLQHLVKNPNNHASILLHPTDDDIVVLQEKERVKQFDHLLNEHQINSVVNPENSKQNINLKNSNMNKITDTQIVENNVHKSKLQMTHVDAMTGTMSEISEILQSRHENVQKK